MGKQSLVCCTNCSSVFYKSEIKSDECPVCQCSFSYDIPEEYDEESFVPESMSLAKRSFVFCTQCKTMFLKSEVKDNCCPGCKCDYSKYHPEAYELDPFVPQSWPFLDIRLHKKFHSVSTNGQFEYTEKKAILTWQKLVVYLISGVVVMFMLCKFAFFLIREISSYLPLCILIIPILVFIFNFILRVCRMFISVDCKNVYLMRKWYGIFTQEKVMPKKNCRVKIWSRPIHTENELYDEWLVSLVYSVNGKREVFDVSTSRYEKKAIRTMRWLTAFIKYAYDEELLPEPETKYGKALTAAEDGDKPTIDEEEKIVPSSINESRNNNDTNKINTSIDSERYIEIAGDTSYYGENVNYWFSGYNNYTYNEDYLPQTEEKSGK